MHTVIHGKKPTPDAPAILFIGGLSGPKDEHTEEWNGKGCVQRIGLQRIMSTFTETFSFDWPGTGRSQKYQVYPKTMAEEAELVQRLAKEKNVNPPYILVAQHIGCYTAIAYAMKFAKEVTAIVLIQPPPLSAYALPIPKNYEKMYPAANARIHAMMHSRHTWPSIFRSTKLVVHLDMVPRDAPMTIQEQGKKALTELEHLFPHIVYHYGATQRIHRIDPYPIIASIVRFFQKMQKPKSKQPRKSRKKQPSFVVSPPRKPNPMRPMPTTIMTKSR
jgi:pimeloyl-ACP methyl ester carboxylesterase